jgi:hypothetical protein
MIFHNGHLIDSARRTLLRAHNMVFRAVINEGYKRLDDAEVVRPVHEAKYHVFPSFRTQI